MNVSQLVTWFSGAYATIDDAQEWYRYDLFNPAAVFELPDNGGYTLAYLREQNYPPHDTAKRIQELVGYKMVSCCDPILGRWKPYKEATK